MENLLKQQASSSFSLQVWLLALQSRLHLLLVTYKQTNYTTLTSTCNTNDFVNAESHTSKRETSACRVKRRLRGSWLNLRFMRKIVRFVKNWTKTGKFAGSTKLQFFVETAKFPTKKTGKFPKIAKDKKFDLLLRVPRLKLRYLQSWWKLSEDRVEKSSVETVIYARTTKNVMSAKNCNICVNPFWNPFYESFRNLPRKENILGGAPLLREIGNILMQENLVMMYMHCTPADVKCRIAQLLTVACKLYKPALSSFSHRP